MGEHGREGEETEEEDEEDEDEERYVESAPAGAGIEPLLEVTGAVTIRHSGQGDLHELDDYDDDDDDEDDEEDDDMVIVAEPEDDDLGMGFDAMDYEMLERASEVLSEVSAQDRVRLAELVAADDATLQYAPVRLYPSSL